MLTFAGVPLLFPGHIGPDEKESALPLKVWRELDAWLTYHHSLEDLSQFSAVQGRIASSRHAVRSRFEQSKGLGLPVLNWPAPPPPRLNTLYWPTGATRWAMGWFITTTKERDRIISQAFTGSTGTRATLRFGEDGKQLGPTMYMLPPRPITKGDVGDFDLWLIPLVDERYFWQFKDFGDNTVTTSTTWASLFSTLGTQLGVAVNVASTVEGAYLKPDPTDFTRRYDNAALLLDAAAWSCGRRIVRRLDGTVLCQSRSIADGVLQSNLAQSWQQLAGGDFSILGGDMPASINVTFRKIKQYLLRSNNQLHTVLSSAPANTPTGPGRLTIHSAAYADYNTSDVLQNGTALTNLATQIKTDFYGWASKDYDRTFARILPWTLSGYDDAVLWRFGALCEDEPQTQTRVQTLPGNFFSEIHLASDSSKEIVEPRQLGKPVEAIAPGEQKEVILWGGPSGSEAALSPEKRVMARNLGSATLGADLFCWLEGINDAAWYGGCYEQ